MYCKQPSLDCGSLVKYYWAIYAQLDSKMNVFLRIAIIFLALTITGCASTVYISSVTDPAHSPTKLDPVYIAVPAGALIKERQFVELLRSEMKEAGFTVTDKLLQSRYSLVAYMDQSTSQINSTLFLPQVQNTSGYVGNTYYSGKTTSTTAVPISVDYTVHKIRLYLFQTSDIDTERFMTVWEGYIGADKEEYQKHSKEILRMLLDVYGTNYEAHTPIRPLPK